MNKADLHIHTTASDSLLDPKDVVRWASIKRLKAVAITDHDTVLGIQEAVDAARAYDIEVVPGVELNTEFDSDEIHILGYFIDYKADRFLAKLEEIRSARYVRAEKMVNRLKEMGIDITLEAVKKLSDDGSIGRPHVARAMIEKGYIENIKEAFEKYIGKGMPAYIERYKLSCQEAVEMIKGIGGVPVLAHPGLLKSSTRMSAILDMGIEGIEVYHSKHDDETIRRLTAIAKSRNLIMTGGSDCHGAMQNGEPILGNVWADYRVVAELKSLSSSKYKF